MKKTVLQIDAAFLGLAGVFSVCADLVSYLAGKGPFGEAFYHNPFVISAVEAHLFAVVTAGRLWLYSKEKDTSSGNWLGIIAHLICGVSNVIWFDVFYRVNASTQGFIITVIHFLFVTLNGIALIKSNAESKHIPANDYA